MFITIQIKYCAFATNTTMLLYHKVAIKIDAFASSLHKHNEKYYPQRT